MYVGTTVQHLAGPSAQLHHLLFLGLFPRWFLSLSWFLSPSRPTQRVFCSAFAAGLQSLSRGLCFCFVCLVGLPWFCSYVLSPSPVITITTLFVTFCSLLFSPYHLSFCLLVYACVSRTAASLNLRNAQDTEAPPVCKYKYFILY